MLEDMTGWPKIAGASALPAQVGRDDEAGHAWTEREEGRYIHGLTGGVELRPRNEGNGRLEEERIGRVKVTLGLVAAIRNWYPESVRSDNTTPYKTCWSG
jgi:hypothetical protein